MNVDKLCPQLLEVGREYILNDNFDIHKQITMTSGYLDWCSDLNFGVDHLQKNPVYQIE